MASLVQRSIFRRGETPPAVPEPAPVADDEAQREARAAEQIRFLREQELRRARTSVPPPRRG